jgi:hypothetical protein
MPRDYILRRIGTNHWPGSDSTGWRASPAGGPGSRRVEEVNDAGGEIWGDLEKGSRVYIHDGPFAGYEGILICAWRVPNVYAC